MRDVAWISAVALALSFWIAVAAVRYVRRDRPHKPMPWNEAARVIGLELLLAVVGALDHGPRGYFAIAALAFVTLAGYLGVARAVWRRRHGLDPKTGERTRSAPATTGLRRA